VIIGVSVGVKLGSGVGDLVGVGDGVVVCWINIELVEVGDEILGACVSSTGTEGLAMVQDKINIRAGITKIDDLILLEVNCLSILSAKLLLP
jgi:hypothetical protein